MNDRQRFGYGVAVAALCVSVSCSKPAVMKAPVPQASQANEAPAHEASVGAPKKLTTTPCELVREHNLEARRAATRRAAAKARELGVPRFAAEEKELTALEASLAERTVTLGNDVVKLGSLDEQRLQMASIPVGSDAAQLLRVREQLESLRAVVTALERGEPPQRSPYDLEVELCQPDARGAWAYWVEHASYSPIGEEGDAWSLTERLRVARITLDGQVILADGKLPTLLDSPQGDPRFIETKDSNCCYSSYSVGAPRVAFVNDQDGDGVPELAISAEYSAEGSFDRVAGVFRFDGARIEQRTLDFDSTEDVDRDGRIDLVFVKLDEAGESCDSGFPEYVSGERYLGHALPDGSYSFDDPTAVAYSRERCPAPPRTLATGRDVWCAKLYGLDPTKLPRQCRTPACPRKGDLTPCAYLDSAVKEFDPPLTLSK